MSVLEPMTAVRCASTRFHCTSVVVGMDTPQMVLTAQVCNSINIDCPMVVVLQTLKITVVKQFFCLIVILFNLIPHCGQLPLFIST